MKFYNILFGLCCFGFVTLFTSCNESILKETPMDFFSPENTFLSKAGFDAAIAGLHDGVRSEMAGADDANEYSMNFYSDLWTSASESPTLVFSQWLNLNATTNYPAFYWDWAYKQVIARANTIITRAENPDVKWSASTDKNQIVAEARFLRGYAYSVLVNLFGGVPIVKEEVTTPRFDYVRASKTEVLNFIVSDLTFASQNLPPTTTQQGRIVKAAADHYLSEMYLCLGQYDNAISSASNVINSGLYKIMTQRFGDLARPGDVFSDLFWTKQLNYSASGNKETIWALQVEYGVTGGIPGDGGNAQIRHYGPAFDNLKDPNNKQAILVCDSLGRGNGWITPTYYSRNTIWASDWNKDIRNSKYNIRRDFYYNNLAPFKGQKIELVTGTDGKIYWKGTSPLKLVVPIDTLRYMFPWFRKLEGNYNGNPSSGKTYNEFIKARLAETYLLRAEAYLMKGDKQKAADDINVLRNRASATLVDPAKVDIDYILDERARELMCEERRLRTLIRMGKVLDRVPKYNFRERDLNSGASFLKANKNELWPIPQSAIDANKDAKLEQNPGY